MTKSNITRRTALAGAAFLRALPPLTMAGAAELTLPSTPYGSGTAAAPVC